MAEILNIKAPAAYALVRSGELPAIQIGGRGQWRVEIAELEAFIARKYAQTRALIDSNDVIDLTDGPTALSNGEVLPDPQRANS